METGGDALLAADMSATGEVVAFGSAGGLVHTWAFAAPARVNAYARPPEAPAFWRAGGGFSRGTALGSAAQAFGAQPKGRARAAQRSRSGGRGTTSGRLEGGGRLGGRL